MSEKTHTISIIIPAYNCETYLPACLNSVLPQTYTNIEIIIIDDGSDDNTLKIIEHHSDKRIKVYAQNHQGVSNARNLGIKNATGEYIFFLDADDTIHPNCINALYSMANKTKADVITIRQPNKFTGDINLTSANRDLSFDIYTGKEAALEMLLYKTVISSWGKLIKRRKVMDNNIYFNPELAYGEGFDFMINLYLNSKTVCFTDEKLYNYRIDSQTSVMSKFNASMIPNSYKALNCIAEHIPNSYNFEAAMRYTFFHTTYDLLNTLLATRTNNLSIQKDLKQNLRTYKPSLNNLNISKKEKLKVLAYQIAPVLTARTINKLHGRVFR